MISAAAAMTPVHQTPALRLSGITKRFGSLTAVDNISLSIARHEVVGLIGENGAGKSTLLKILTGVHQPDGGAIEVNGREARFRTPMEANAEGIGIVHQEQSLFTNMTVAENIVMGAGQGAVRFGFYKWGEAKRQAAEILARIGSPIDPSTKVGDLSFAHRQMVEIARTIEIARAGTKAMNGKAGGGVPVVILDEPTSVLERGESEILEREIQKLKEIGSVIFVSHRLEEVLRICDRIVVMRHGRVVADRPREGVTEDDLFELMIGQAARSTARKPSAPVGSLKPVLHAEKLTRHGAFRDVSLSVYPGRVAAIVGTFGSGREEFCRALFGAETYESGTLAVEGDATSRWSIRKAVDQGLAYLPAERGVEGVVGGLSAARNLTLVHPGESASGIFLKPRKRDEIARDWFERLDVRPRQPHLELERFSGGNQQKVALAKWMASGKAKVLILDHPLRGLDPGAGETVKRHMRMACQNGAGLILLADTLEEALELGDEIVVMRDGEVTARFDMSKDNPTTLDLLEKMV